MTYVSNNACKCWIYSFFRSISSQLPWYKELASSGSYLVVIYSPTDTFVIFAECAVVEEMERKK